MRLSCRQSLRSLPARTSSLFALACCLACIGISCPVRAQRTTPTVENSAATGSGSAVPAPQLKANLNRILEGSEFHTEAKDENWVKDAITKAKKTWQRIREWWDHLFSSGGLQAGSSLVIYVLLTFICAGLVWVVIRMFRNWSPREYSARSASALAADEEALAEIERDPDVWLAQAEEWVAKADYRRAFRAVFFAILLKLDRAGALSYDRARTNGDYLRQLQHARNQPLYDSLVTLADAFDARWYGNRPTSEQDYQAILNAHKRLPDLIRSTTIPSALTGRQDSPTPLPNHTPALP